MAKAASESGTLHITVCTSPAPRVVHTLAMALPAGACVRDALALCAADQRFAIALQSDVHCAVWGVKAVPTQALHDQDRLELCRPLRVDPKVARRERFAQQGARTSGLFKARRPGAKSGY
jgi:putative ubiquitin-RnfH superfamily antitoxin RatB of RatAB toxin-antitoxin module